MPRADTEALNAHLIEIARTVTPGAHAVLILDGAGWHKSDALVVPDTISLQRDKPGQAVWRVPQSAVRS